MMQFAAQRAKTTALPQSLICSPAIGAPSKSEGSVLIACLVSGVDCGEGPERAVHQHGQRPRSLWPETAVATYVRCICTATSGDRQPSLWCSLTGHSELCSRCAPPSVAPPPGPGDWMFSAYVSNFLAEHEYATAPADAHGGGGVTYAGLTLHKPARWHVLWGTGMSALMWCVLFRLHGSRCIMSCS